MVSVDVAVPLYGGVSVRSTHVCSPDETCHRYSNVGSGAAATEKCPVCPASTSRRAGCCVMVGPAVAVAVCVTANTTPATVTLPVRVAPVVLALTPYETLPDPVPVSLP